MFFMDVTQVGIYHVFSRRRHTRRKGTYRWRAPYPEQTVKCLSGNPSRLLYAVCAAVVPFHLTSNTEMFEVPSDTVTALQASKCPT
mmetsp:Transcript_12066/g.34989  ORF Transcript_12066/g.34989 Transcript_12066/m.34989 type:complete len:86 (-) Transcript_12066:802-1059(-)